MSEKNYRTSMAWTAPLALVVVALLAMSVFSGCGPSSDVKAGMAEKVITPPVGMNMSGYRREGPSTGVHDDLYARSIAIEDGNGDSVLLMTLGLINLAERNMDEIRSRISGQTGIEEKNIVISCTHTHSGPSVPRDSDYEKSLIENCVASGIEAWNNREPSFVGVGSTVCLDLAQNDRRMRYGGLHPDPEVGIIKVENLKGRITGVAFVFGCHPSTLDLHNLEFTEDWPYFAINGIKEQIGEDTWVAYFQSAQGDVKIGYSAELSAVGADMKGLRSFWFAEHKASHMTWAVLEALDDIETSGTLTVDATSGYYDFPLRESYPISAAEAERRDKEARARLEEMEQKADSIGKRVLDEYRVDVFLSGLTLGCARWVENNPDPEPLTMLLQSVRIGDAVFTTFPVEVFTEIGKSVKDRSPVDKTFVIGLASGHGGYMPTAAEYLEGGYAAVMTRYSPKCEQVLIDSSLELIGKVSDQ